MRAMQIRRFLTTSHQRRRLVLWVLAMLNWIAAVLFAGRTITARQLRQREHVCLDRLTRTTICLLIVRSAELIGRRPCGRPSYFKRGRDLKRRHLIRSLLGARLRRVLSYRGDAFTRIQKLTQVLRRLDAHARLLFRRPLTRLFPIPATATPWLCACPHDAPLSAPAFCDSS
jgi:hypothetical protein